MFRQFTLTVLSLAFIPTAYADDVSIDLFDGTWINDRGSVVMIEQTGDNLTGHYKTALGQPDESETFPLTGWAQGDVISFSVNFKGYGSMTAWNGQLSEDETGPYIRTLWHLSRNVEDKDEDDDMWSSVIAGSSEFRKSINKQN